MTACIRAASLSDLPLILAIEKATPAAAHWPVSEYEKLLQEGVLLVAEQESGITGFVCAKSVAGEAELENIAVAESFRRSGIANRLLKALIERSAAQGIRRIFLEVRDSNRAARSLYVKHGFREVGKRRAYYQHPPEDAVIYELHVRARREFT